MREVVAKARMIASNGTGVAGGRFAVPKSWQESLDSSVEVRGRDGTDCEKALSINR